MGRQRKLPAPRSRMAVAETNVDSERRAVELYRLSQPARGRAVRVDQKRDGMILADLIPPTPQEQWRKTRGMPGRKPTPRREARASAALMGIYAQRGEHLTAANATRILEQARRFIDKTRGIGPKDRKTIEQARGIIGSFSRSKTHVVWITQRDLLTVRQAVARIQNAPTQSKGDQELIAQVRAIQRRVQVH
jgi:hypothetical protein